METWSKRCHMLPPNVHVCSTFDYASTLQSADRILAEGAQGFSLGLNERFYPFCTSRDCTPTRLLAEMGIPWYMLKDVIGTYRTYPIRVGGNSGPCYSDQTELDWADLRVKPERTTVTNRERRIFTFSQRQTDDARMACGPTKAFLNFANYCRTPDEVEYILDLIGRDIVQWVGYGPNVQDVRRLH